MRKGNVSLVCTVQVWAWPEKWFSLLCKHLLDGSTEPERAWYQVVQPWNHWQGRRSLIKTATREWLHRIYWLLVQPPFGSTFRSSLFWEVNKTGRNKSYPCRRGLVWGRWLHRYRVSSTARYSITDLTPLQTSALFLGHKFWSWCNIQLIKWRGPKRGNERSRGLREPEWQRYEGGSCVQMKH